MNKSLDNHKNLIINFETKNFEYCIKFSCVIDYNTLVNYIKSNYPSDNMDNIIFMSELASGYLVQTIFTKINELLVDVSVIDYKHINIDYKPYEYSFDINLPIDGLMGHSLSFYCSDMANLELIKQKISSYNLISPIKLSPINGILDLEVNDNTYKIKVHEKMFSNIKGDYSARYLKLSLLVQGEVVVVFINRTMVNYILKNWLNHADEYFDSNEYFTNIALDILVSVLNDVLQTNIEVIKWNFCELLAKDYILMELLYKDLATNILFLPDDNAFLLELLNNYLITDSNLDQENCIDDNTKIDFKVIVATASLPAVELSNLTKGDIILCDELVKKDMLYIDLGKCILEASTRSSDVVEDVNLLHITGVLSDD